MESGAEWPVTIRDDFTVPMLIEKTLGIKTVHFRDTQTLLSESRKYRPLALFVDIHLGSDVTGLRVISQLRRRWPFTAIIVVTSDESDESLVEALASGADDFVRKPIRPNELRARLQVRLRAILQREENSKLRIGDVTFDAKQRNLIGNGTERSLSPLSCEVLRILISAKGGVVSRTTLRKQAWSRATEINTLQFLTGLLGTVLSIAREFEEKEAAIRALKASELKLTEERERADRATAAKSEFLATLSHEIRTPLNGVIGTTELLLDTSLEPNQRELADTIHTSGDTLLYLINDILDFSKIEAKRLELERIDFSLADILGQVSRTLEFGARREGLELKLESPLERSQFFKGDPGRIRQVLLNLMANAIKFTGKGSVTLRVTRAETLPKATRLLIEVIDTGIGISEENRTKLFQPFAQADASTARQFGGTGLGLSISQSLVQLMGGEMGVRSVAGDGSTFWFTLLLDHGVAPVPVSPRAGEWRPLKVLVVDDNSVNQLLSERMLVKLGHSAVAVSSGPDALNALQANSFDLILMDCQMPGMDGFETTRAIRSRETRTGKYVPVLALTANASIEDQQKCLASGMNAFASKPITLKKMEQGIVEALRGATQSKAA